MAIFGNVLRKIETAASRLQIVCWTVEANMGLGAKELRLIGSTEHAEVYEIVSDSTPSLVIKTPPFRLIGETNQKGLDKFDEGCFAILGEMEALSRIGNCAFVNVGLYAKNVFDVPVIFFRKRHADLRQLIATGKMSANPFIKLATLYMIAKGLVAAQQRGVLIHQDLKPENILIDYASQLYDVGNDYPSLIIPRINDFELANRVVDRKLRGFRPYLPSEHYSEFDQQLLADNRYDSYSLAVIAHELLTCGYHPMAVDGQNLHYSAYVASYATGLRNENKWKAFARKPVLEKPLPAIMDRKLAVVLGHALAPDFRERPSAVEMAAAFYTAMVRENSTEANKIILAMEWLEESGEIGSGASSLFPEQAIRLIKNAPSRLG